MTNISHELLMKAVRKHIDNKWVLLYVERWLKAPMQRADGTLMERTKGTPQGGVVSPVLSNLFLHYVFDTWMQRNHPGVPWCRYADDGVVHCETRNQAQCLRAELERRFAECELKLHPDKTKIVYCKDGGRKGQHSNTQFTFLGYDFRPRLAKSRKRGNFFVSFSPAVSKAAMKSMRTLVRRSNVRNRSDLGLNEIAGWFNPIIRGWLQYYGRYRPSAMYPVLRHFNQTLVTWAMRKYKRLRGRRTRAGRFLLAITQRDPSLFAHWARGMVGQFA